MQISQVRVAECQIPLPKVLRLGPIRITSRDYVAIRIETDHGLFGEAIGYPRGTPLFEILCRMARSIIDENASMRREVMVKLDRANVPARATITRGLSLLDVALWDLGAKAAGQPLFKLLGGFQQSAEVTVVAGYYVDQRSISDVVGEVAGLADAGFARMKIMLKGDDAPFDRKYAAAIAERLPGQIAADAHWSWTTLTEAKAICRDLDGFGLNFLEDPFAAGDWRMTHELQQILRTPLAAGEDVFGARAFADLVSGIGLLRVDATTCGGITGAIEAINLAAAAGRTVLPHVFPPLHLHLACAFPNVEGVEMIPLNSGADPLQYLLRYWPTIHDGRMRVSDEPGAGIALDWDAIERLAQRVEVVRGEV